MKLLKALSREQQATLVTVNLFFLMIFLFGYSPLSLVFLFISWLILMGVTLHLIFLATSEDDYEFNFSGTKQAKADSIKSQQSVPLEERDEFIAPKTIFRLILAMYKVALTLLQQYKNLEQARNPQRTQRFLMGLPAPILIIYFCGISDTFVGWVFINYLILMPSWPAVKSSIVVPSQAKRVITVAKRLLIPRWIRSSDPGSEKQKTE